MSGWIDCTHPIDARMPQPPGFPCFCLRQHTTGIFSMQQLSIGTHHGTHVDAPLHFIAEGVSIADIPMARLSGHGVVADIPVASSREIALEELRQASGPDLQGAILLLRTGWSARYGADDYIAGPYLTGRTADHLAQAGISVLGVDFLSPDEPRQEGRPADFDYPVHRRLLGAGIPIVENLALTAAPAGRCEVVVAPLPLAGGDGAPARVLVRPVQDRNGGVA